MAYYTPGTCRVYPAHTHGVTRWERRLIVSHVGIQGVPGVYSIPQQQCEQNSILSKTWGPCANLVYINLDISPANRSVSRGLLFI